MRAYLRVVVAAIATACGMSCSDVTQPSRLGRGLSIESVAPTSGPTSGGTAVTLTGTNFTPSVGVRFGLAPATVQFEHPNRLIAITGPHPAGTVDVVVTLGGGTTSLANAFTYTTP
jgi:hypothetical protein